MLNQSDPTIARLHAIAELSSKSLTVPENYVAVVERGGQSAEILPTGKHRLVGRFGTTAGTYALLPKTLSLFITTPHLSFAAAGDNALVDTIFGATFALGDPIAFFNQFVLPNTHVTQATLQTALARRAIPIIQRAISNYEAVDLNEPVVNQPLKAEILRDLGASVVGWGLTLTEIAPLIFQSAESLLELKQRSAALIAEFNTLSREQLRDKLQDEAAREEFLRQWRFENLPVQALMPVAQSAVIAPSTDWVDATIDKVVKTVQALVQSRKAGNVARLQGDAEPIATVPATIGGGWLRWLALLPILLTVGWFSLQLAITPRDELTLQMWLIPAALLVSLGIWFAVGKRIGQQTIEAIAKREPSELEKLTDEDLRRVDQLVRQQVVGALKSADGNLKTLRLNAVRDDDIETARQIKQMQEACEQMVRKVERERPVYLSQSLNLSHEQLDKIMIADTEAVHDAHELGILIHSIREQALAKKVLTKELDGFKLALIELDRQLLQRQQLQLA